ncbi:MAG TPA: hypothetical protein VMF11_08400 [Candidatus Baltobacteraceae bacterium]|nr:hypothetical protein [Candidatus Baltobacteraceae bacterium]
MAVKAGGSPRQQIVNFLFGPIGFALLLGLITAVLAVVVNLFDRDFIAAAIRWFHDASPGPDSSTALLAVGSISAVVWTGALIAFQLKGTSPRLSGAFSLLEYAFIAPLVALLMQGGTLRVVAVIATLAFIALSLRQVLLYFLIEFVRRKTAAGDPDREFFATDLGRRMFKGVAGVTIFPIGYAGACGLGSLIVAVLTKEYTAAITSVGALCFGLYYILVTLKENKVPPTPAQRATAQKAFADMIAIFKRRAEELTANASTGDEAAGAPTPQDVSPHVVDSTEIDDSRARQKAERLARIADLKEVVAFLDPLRDEQPRPGLLTQEQVEKARAVLSYAMNKGVNDENAFNLALGLSQFLAAVAPEERNNAS